MNSFNCIDMMAKVRRTFQVMSIKGRGEQKTGVKWERSFQFVCRWQGCRVDSFPRTHHHQRSGGKIGEFAVGFFLVAAAAAVALTALVLLCTFKQPFVMFFKRFSPTARLLARKLPRRTGCIYHGAFAFALCFSNFALKATFDSLPSAHSLSTTHLAPTMASTNPIRNIPLFSLPTCATFPHANCRVMFQKHFFCHRRRALTLSVFFVCGVCPVTIFTVDLIVVHSTCATARRCIASDTISCRFRRI